ncbi:hypothetical protein [Croceivirga thetidis]|uniref:PrcB C-terminal domain-containing protein n=1 Tax=Croceivirga thetidis TaxID=2721623 RepID=A0ABX1GQ20_9FLAO|nr:hypothetical protein [Croceivirga thetidis]NKI32000.1 hypothetical protein [Croceivirga thetidis]
MRKLMRHAIKIHTSEVLLVILALTFVFACKSKQRVDSMNPEKPKQQMELLLHDAYFLSDSLITEVVRDEKSLQKFFSKVNLTRKPGLPVPIIDFSKNDVIIVCAGKTKTKGYPILEISTEDSNQITVLIQQSDIDKSADNQAISYPFSVYVTPKTDKKYVFKNQ